MLSPVWDALTYHTP